MAYTEELISSRADWETLCAQAAEGGAALALIGRSGRRGGMGYLVAETSTSHLPFPIILALCRAEEMGLLELRPACTAEQATTRLVELARTLPGVTLVLAKAATPCAAWRWDARRGAAAPLAGLRLVGGNGSGCLLERIPFGDRPPAAPLHPRLQRQLPVFGEAGQRQLGMLTVAIVGCGGTGGLLAQQLAMAGVGRLLLVDDDRIEQSNRNRTIAATDADVRRGAYKVATLRRHLRRLAPDVRVVALPRSLYDQRSTTTILTADVLVGCTDNEGSRLHLNHLAIQYLLPYVDCGAGVERRNGEVVAGGQVRVILPGGPCLECYGGINRWRAARDLDAPHDPTRNHAHGYGLGDEQPAPSLVFLNAIIAAEATASAVALATGFRAVVPFLAYNLISARLAPREDAQRSLACPSCAPGQRYGRGDSLPLPRPAEAVRLPSPKVASIPDSRNTRLCG